MDINRVDMFMMTTNKYFPPESILLIRERLLKMDEYKFSMLSTMTFKDPTTMLIISIFAGFLGVDRFMMGDIGMGILKLFTGGLCGILTVIDWFTISKRTREVNLQLIMSVL